MVPKSTALTTRVENGSPYTLSQEQVYALQNTTETNANRYVGIEGLTSSFEAYQDLQESCQSRTKTKYPNR